MYVNPFPVDALTDVSSRVVVAQRVQQRVDCDCSRIKINGRLFSVPAQMLDVTAAAAAADFDADDDEFNKPEHKVLAADFFCCVAEDSVLKKKKIRTSVSFSLPALYLQLRALGLV